MRTFSCMDWNNQVSRSAYCCPHFGNTRVSEHIKNAEYLSEVVERKKNEKSRAKKYYNGNVDEMRKLENEIEKKAEEKKRHLFLALLQLKPFIKLISNQS